MEAIAKKTAPRKKAASGSTTMVFRNDLYTIEKAGRGGYPVRYLNDGLWMERKIARVTAALDVAPQPWMKYWSANQERDLMLDAAFMGVARMSRDYLPEQFDPQHVRSLRSMSTEEREAHEQKPCRRCERYKAFSETIKGAAGEIKGHEKTSKTARDLGSYAHALVHQATMKMLGAPIPEPSKEGLSRRQIELAVWAFMSWEDWCKRVEFVPLSAETRVFHWDDDYAGQFDAVGRVEGRIGPIDYKTSKGIFAEAHVQVGRYYDALEWMIERGLLYLPKGEKLGGSWIVRLPKIETDPEAEFIEAQPAAETREVYLALQTVMRWSKKKEKKKESEA